VRGTLALARALAAALLLHGVPAPAAAQQPAEAAALPAASPLLPADHWAVRAAVRAEALGLAPGFHPAQRSAPRAAVGEALRQAVLAAGARGPALAALARGWRARFLEEFPEAEGLESGTLARLGSAVGGGYERRGGLAEPGSGLFGRRVGITSLPLHSTLVGTATAAAALAPYLAAVAEPYLSEEGVEVPRWDVTAGWGPVALSVGREPVGYGPGEGGGIVLSGAQALPRAQVETTRPLSLPGPLRYLGPVAFHTFVTRLDERRHPGDPYLWGARVALRPHPRLTVGINRASIFGGDSVATEVGPGSVGRMLLGILSDDFENQVVAAEFRYRLPTERVLPLTLYLEWGADDGAGAWWDVPARVLGAYVPAVPGAPAVGAGAEYTAFAALCCGNPGWYTHAAQPGGWAAGGEVLGHPLGGEGQEFLLYSHADLADARLRLEGRAFRRERGREGYDAFPRAGNLFAPELAGWSTGGALAARWRVSPDVELRLRALREVGSEWRSHELDLNASVLF
jgi:hypothetical protein